MSPNWAVPEGKKDQARLYLTPGFLVPYGVPASLNLVYLWLLLCFVSKDFNTL